MKKFDHLDLDGHLLKLLRTVIDTGSVTRAAMSLGLTQSAVSHQLDRLRAITGDTLFVKSGRSISPTARAIELAASAQDLIERLAQFATSAPFSPDRFNQTITIAANDLQRDLLLAPLFDRLHSQAPALKLRVIPSDIPSAQMLREDLCDLVISPRPPDATDIKHKRLFEDHYRVFYDDQHRKAPRSLRAYLAADHVSVVYPTQRPLDIDDWMLKQRVQRNMVITVNHFAGLAAFVKGSARLATLPSLLHLGQLRGLQHTRVPVHTPTMPMYAIWHIKHHQEAMHQWLRSHLWDVVQQSVNFDK